MVYWCACRRTSGQRWCWGRRACGRRQRSSGSSSRTWREAACCTTRLRAATGCARHDAEGGAVCRVCGRGRRSSSIKTWLDGVRGLFHCAGVQGSYLPCTCKDVLNAEWLCSTCSTQCRTAGVVSELCMMHVSLPAHGLEQLIRSPICGSFFSSQPNKCML
jgi:hypothetical protein